MATRTYGIFWRWHFLAGLVACPVIFVVAVTGALYTFQPELERVMYPDVSHVVPRGERLSLDRIAGAVSDEDCVPSSILLPSARDQAARVYCAEEGAFSVDPYRAEVLGAWDSPLLTILFGLHWELLLGEKGRLVVEWATSWTILLMLSGAYLWWPRGRRGGTWWPRGGPRIAPRQRLRDLHAIFGAYAIPALLAIAFTGLFWTKLAGGERWHRLVDATEEHAEEAPMVSAPARWWQARISAQAALEAAGLGGSPYAVSTVLPAERDAAYIFYAYDDTFRDPSVSRAIHIDAFTGERVGGEDWDQHSSLGKVSAYGYGVHVGAVLGVPGRILACLAALILAALTITGPWMWWKRRPRGGLGVPPRPERVPRGLLVLLAALGWLLPTVGWTLIAVLAFELARHLWQRRAGARIG